MGLSCLKQLENATYSNEGELTDEIEPGCRYPNPIPLRRPDRGDEGIERSCLSYYEGPLGERPLKAGTAKCCGERIRQAS